MESRRTGPVEAPVGSGMHVVPTTAEHDAQSIGAPVEVRGEAICGVEYSSVVPSERGVEDPIPYPRAIGMEFVVAKPADVSRCFHDRSVDLKAPPQQRAWGGLRRVEVVAHSHLAPRQPAHLP